MDEKKSLKSCSKCRVAKPLSEFRPRADRPGKVRSQCKDCERETQRARYPKARAATKRWQQKNKNKVNAHNRRWQSENRDKYRESCSKAYHKRKDDPLFVRRRKAQNVLTKAIEKGSIALSECSLESDECNGKLHGHHFDYGSPLKVVPLCHSHHLHIHSVMRKHGIECDY